MDGRPGGRHSRHAHRCCRITRRRICSASGSSGSSSGAGVEREELVHRAALIPRGVNLAHLRPLPAQRRQGVLPGARGSHSRLLGCRGSSRLLGLSLALLLLAGLEEEAIRLLGLALCCSSPRGAPGDAPLGRRRIAVVVIAAVISAGCLGPMSCAFVAIAVRVDDNDAPLVSGACTPPHREPGCVPLRRVRHTQRRSGVVGRGRVAKNDNVRVLAGWRRGWCFLRRLWRRLGSWHGCLGAAVRHWGQRGEEATQGASTRGCCLLASWPTRGAGSSAGEPAGEIVHVSRVKLCG